MASGKISPRQKMINMMYLVLTAILALNVSSEILLSFQVIGGSLRRSSDKMNAQNDGLATLIKNSIDKEMETGNRNNEKYKAEADLIRKQTGEYVRYIESLITAIRSDTIAGWDPAQKTLKRIDELEKNYRFFMFDGAGGDDLANGGRGSGQAKILKDKTAEYIRWTNGKFIELNSTDKAPFNPAHKEFRELCLNPAEDSTIAASSEIKNKSWEYYTFHSAPAIANVAILEKLKNDLRVVETGLLEVIKGKLNEIEIKPGEFVLMEAPSSQHVIMGMPFESDVFIAMKANTEFHPQFSGPGLSYNPTTGKGRVRLTATLPEGRNEGQQNYTANVRIPKQSGGFKTLSLNSKFTVHRPHVKVEGPAIQNLYRDCANDVFITVPELSTLYNPEVETQGGQVQKNQTHKDKFRVIPKADKVTLAVYQNNNGQKFKIENLIFNALTPPKPEIQVFVNNKEFSNQPIKITDKITVKIKPDPVFAKQLPNDARYRIKGIAVLGQKGMQSAAPTGGDKPATKASKDATCEVTFSPDANYNRVYLEIKGVERVNYADKSIEEKFQLRELTIPFDVRK